MAKPVIKFSAVAYQVGTGTQIRTGYRPQLEAQDGRYDLDFCKEVVTEKRLAMSPEELLHAMEMVGEVGPAKVAEDGRPRGITKLLKYNRYAQGNLESPTSPWNESCKAVIRPQLMWDADKAIDATFENVMSGIGVKLNYVAWVGAKTVINVVKIGKQIGVYGNHMEFIVGDTATLTVGTQVYTLTCVESDVAHAIFAWPAGLAPEAGTLAEFVMKSRGGVEDGQVYTSKKTVTILAADPLPTITKIETDDLGGLNKGAGFNVKGTDLEYVASRGDEVKATWTEGSTPKSQTFVPSGIASTQLDFPTTSAWDNANAGTVVTFTVKIDGTTLTKTSEVLGA